MGTRGDLTLPQVAGTARNHQPQNRAWPWGFTSQKPETKDKEERHLFCLVIKKNDTQTASCTFFKYCLCFKYGERQMNAEDSGYATKKCVSLRKIQN